VLEVLDMKLGRHVAHMYGSSIRNLVDIYRLDPRFVEPVTAVLVD
jgi:hypothetical protein